MHRLQTEMIPWDELNLVKNYLSGQFLRSADGPFAMMELHTMVETRGLTYAFYEEALEAIQHVTPEILLQTAQNHLNFKDFLIVTAG
jgi:predicted Zn-dependent peptidase